ncbi:(2Fe-2S)-binding protein [Mesorhizobium sp.]|uniref:(2Fe-2S)-binding protein n=1 Tax=Mesorhizobium sp. TaxID=1871066 RepID=UPI0011FBCFCB|nr:(2Fe-2S)-binding protein [Mesorhizobium sp.]TIS53914.1 MAG: (2Fe-2S)-binding protein [Mesorhizobium sp.]TIS86013.1 MAG: (2Fe-2S)-binding protein [Mesorhizobium sp.]
MGSIAKGRGQFRRIAAADERTSVAFEVDGQPMTALTGDTVLTAILLQQRHIRRFEFADELRSGFCLMGACQDCWVRLADGRSVRACTTAVENGMKVETRSEHDVPR